MHIKGVVWGVGYRRSKSVKELQCRRMFFFHCWCHKLPLDPHKDLSTHFFGSFLDSLKSFSCT
uniref:Uncharacterized protein n=1 Tax=Lepeophtheirus salmonis TaxID=72036 RepID=A0A0K2V1L3_LEPSM